MARVATYVIYDLSPPFLLFFLYFYFYIDTISSQANLLAFLRNILPSAVTYEDTHTHADTRIDFLTMSGNII